MSGTQPKADSTNESRSGKEEGTEASGKQPSGESGIGQGAVTRCQASDGHLSDDEPDDEAGTT